ncbi:MAG: hypothetical protein HOE48_15315 [Candidatus Latescibacteria bacterium]|jgi:hypothetical protein|nr:hypothetical protein [Candidatus Latescibacterota bacterium]MBT4139289.1 hypothetical protein [Candidatus Latescibacterota bacterium]MBT5831940.1 hypothetical protein [Candidatus Latescibacterota bacterium]
MVSKWVGILLMAVGGLMAWAFVWPLMMSIVVVFWQVLKLGVVVFVAYVGYRLWRQRCLLGT